ncbi:MAG: Hsp20/alpha crystallin family protein [Planctomycetes bacterium]|nr:Hsp20/alpha crystallin family protein [Planctomycetota bacterium]
MKDVAKWNPWATLFGTPFDEGIRDAWSRALEGNEGSWKPRADVVETPETYVIKAEMPGIDPDDITVTMTGDTLTLRGERRHEEKREEEHWHVVERTAGTFVRTFRIPTRVDSSGVEAEMKNGILEVTVRKAPEESSKRIKVKATK